MKKKCLVSTRDGPHFNTYINNNYLSYRVHKPDSFIVKKKRAKIVHIHNTDEQQSAVFITPTTRGNLSPFEQGQKVCFEVGGRVFLGHNLKTGDFIKSYNFFSSGQSYADFQVSNLVIIIAVLLEEYFK